MDNEHVDEAPDCLSPSSGPHAVVFEAPSPAITGDDVAGSYSGEAWFGIVGPAGWLVWRQIGRRLRGRTELAWTLEGLADATALPVDAVRWGLHQLARHGVAERVGTDRWRVVLPAVGREPARSRPSSDMTGRSDGTLDPTALSRTLGESP